MAAYKLDRMLDWQMVPTAVITEVEGDEGALSDWVENSINERDRLDRKYPLPAIASSTNNTACVLYSIF